MVVGGWEDVGSVDAGLRVGDGVAFLEGVVGGQGFRRDVGLLDEAEAAGEGLREAVTLLDPRAGGGLAVDDLWHWLGGECGGGEFAVELGEDAFNLADESGEAGGSALAATATAGAVEIHLDRLGEGGADGGDGVGGVEGELDGSGGEGGEGFFERVCVAVEGDGGGFGGEVFEFGLYAINRGIAAFFVDGLDAGEFAALAGNVGENLVHLLGAGVSEVLDAELAGDIGEGFVFEIRADVFAERGDLSAGIGGLLFEAFHGRGGVHALDVVEPGCEGFRGGGGFGGFLLGFGDGGLVHCNPGGGVFGIDEIGGEAGGFVGIHAELGLVFLG